METSNIKATTTTTKTTTTNTKTYEIATEARHEKRAKFLGGKRAKIVHAQTFTIRLPAAIAQAIAVAANIASLASLLSTVCNQLSPYLPSLQPITLSLSTFLCFTVWLCVYSFANITYNRASLADQRNRTTSKCEIKSTVFLHSILCAHKANKARKIIGGASRFIASCHAQMLLTTNQIMNCAIRLQLCVDSFTHTQNSCKLCTRNSCAHLLVPILPQRSILNLAQLRNFLCNIYAQMSNFKAKV